MTSPKQSKRTLWTLALLFLLTLLPACARNSVAPVQTNVKAVACVHPVVDVSTRQGTYEALAAYYSAIETCNALNGVGAVSVLTPSANAPDASIAVPKAHGRVYKLFHREKGSSTPAPAVVPGVTTVIVPAVK